MFTDFFHKLLHPHCEQCKISEEERLARAEELKICKTCEFLKMELAKERQRSGELLASILTTQKANEAIAPVPNYEPIPSPYVPWHVRQRTLEEEDRKKALMFKDKAALTTEDLEKELLDERTS